MTDHAPLMDDDFTTARIVIGGGPCTGKTTLASALHRGLGHPVRHTDDTMNLGWSEASAEVAAWMTEPGPWIIEGVATARALRKAMAADGAGQVCDILLWLTDPRVEQSAGQKAMAKGCDTVLAEILPAVQAAGTRVQLVTAAQVDDLIAHVRQPETARPGTVVGRRIDGHEIVAEFTGADGIARAIVLADDDTASVRRAVDGAFHVDPT